MKTSECLICKGPKPSIKDERITIIPLDEFLSSVALEIWGNVDAWTIKFNDMDIDNILTKSQVDVNSGVEFEKTEFYTIICLLINHGVKIAMWYDIYSEDLPICKNRKEVLIECYRGITDISGMCEIYFKMV